MAGENVFEPVIKPASVKVFNCPACGAGVVLRAAGQSVSAVCGSCASVIDTKDENFQVIHRSMTQPKRKPLIPLGQRGKLKGTLWEVIGFMERSEAGYAWDEYLLFNPTRGFRWLTEANGHWNYVLITKEKPTRDLEDGKITDMNRIRVRYLDKRYYLFHRGTAKVTYVEGEFYWQVNVGESAKVEDYVNPPEILSRETTDLESIWSLGEYIESRTVKLGFDIKSPMPVQNGVAPNQVSALGPKHSETTKYWALLAGLLLLLQLISLVAAENRVVYEKVFAFSAVDADPFRVSSKFVLTGKDSNVQIKMSAPVMNSWMEADIDLVNDDNGKVYEVQQGIEFYYGQDSDGAWSEGARVSKKLLSAIPAGNYHLNVEVSGPSLPPALYRNAQYQIPDVKTPVNAVFVEEKWPNGKVKSSTPMLFEKAEGIAKFYREDGRLEKEVSYSNNLLHGLSRNYDEQGNVDQAFAYINGNRIAEDVLKNSIVNALPVTLTVTRGVPNWSNFFLAFLLLSVYPLIVWWRSRSFEMERWSQSDFSPYSSHQHGDD